ncbi:MAG: TIGR03905 family TSCPD domain-containing protein [Clostridia bacterium]|nr:TIGR03905 family TSCPD domain-containing protein [Clostridia bacterium]MBQ7224063.1 TIGR03905 family TSCPD domain-containing protein [Clostridia bacterium]
MESFRTSGTCCREIVFTVDENDILTSVRFVNGCSGNTQGISRLSVGQHIDDIIAKLEGIKCRAGTSCPDQFAKALKLYKENKGKPREE